ncbi:EAL domain-containing protein [Rhodoferax sp. WC2427]|uniref:bifunctional diguanylate cyclase/phosphodiesterase n=1 Tax=Rhodoferax sp. WC2427 TaxID=3234144 RepID=UPI003466EFBD
MHTSVLPHTDAHRRLKASMVALGVLAVASLLVTLAMPPLTGLALGHTDMLSVHTVMEFFAILVAMQVVSVSWHAFDAREARSAPILVCGFLIVACCDLVHALSYAGMPDFLAPSGTPRAIFFWLMGRSFEVATMALVAVEWVPPLSRKFWLCVGVGVSAGLVWFGSYALEAFPATFVSGQGVTPFKANFEYVLCLLNLAVALVLWRRAERSGLPRLYMLALSSFVMGVGELSFTAYVAPSDFQNIFGHAYKLVAYVLLYQATFVTSIRQPFEDLRRSENSLRASENRYHSALASLSEGVVVQGASGAILTANRAAASILGLTVEQLLGLGMEAPHWHAIQPDGLPWPADAYPFNVTLRTGRPTSKVTMGIYKPDGSLVWILVNCEPMGVPGDTVVRSVVTSFTDITLRKEAETQLRIAAIAFESQEGMMITDARHVILRVNQAFIENTGYSAQEVVGKTPRMLQSGRHDRAFYAAMWEVVNRTGVWQGEVWDRRKNGEQYPNWLTISAVKGADGTVTHYVGAHLDISRRKAAEDQLHRLSFYDPLTQLPNRRLLLDRLGHALANHARSQRPGAVLLIDLDHFKTLNDTQGHEVGDRLLIQVAQRLQCAVRQGDTVARLGGDEFVVLLESFDPDSLLATQIEVRAEKICLALDQPYQLQLKPEDGQRHTIEYHSTASIGVTLLGGGNHNVDELLMQADLAMYQAKNSGRHAIRFFDPDMQARVNARTVLEAEMREALLKGQFLLHYQPQVEGGQQRLTGVEVLVRWLHPERGMVSPAAFIPLAETSGLILPLGAWVLRTACTQLAAWAGQPHMADLTVAVNVSAHQFAQPDFTAQVLDVLAQTGAPPQRLKLELTESTLVSNVEAIIAKMLLLKAHGVGFSLDDFGTGYSSLSYLKRLPLDQLKIDQSFVRDVLTDPNDAAIAQMIVALGGSLGLAVIAEGVEMEAQRQFLAAHGCHAYQGYLFSKPLPLEAFEALAQRRLDTP